MQCGRSPCRPGACSARPRRPAPRTPNPNQRPTHRRKNSLPSRRSLRVPAPPSGGGGDAEPDLVMALSAPSLAYPPSSSAWSCAETLFYHRILGPNVVWAIFAACSHTCHPLPPIKMSGHQKVKTMLCQMSGPALVCRAAGALTDKHAFISILQGGTASKHTAERVKATHFHTRQ